MMGLLSMTGQYNICTTYFSVCNIKIDTNRLCWRLIYWHIICIVSVFWIVPLNEQNIPGACTLYLINDSNQRKNTANIGDFVFWLWCILSTYLMLTGIVLQIDVLISSCRCIPTRICSFRIPSFGINSNLILNKRRRHN